MPCLPLALCSRGVPTILLDEAIELVVCVGDFPWYSAESCCSLLFFAVLCDFRCHTMAYDGIRSIPVALCRFSPSHATIALVGAGNVGSTWERGNMRSSRVCSRSGLLWWRVRIRYVFWSCWIPLVSWCPFVSSFCVVAWGRRLGEPGSTVVADCVFHVLLQAYCFLVCICRLDSRPTARALLQTAEHVAQKSSRPG